MNFAFLINSLYGGGSEKQGRMLAEKLNPASVFLLHGPARDFPRSQTRLLSENGESIFEKANFGLQKKAVGFARHIKTGEVVLSFMERANFINILSAREKRHICLISERTTPSREFSGLRALLNKRLIRKLYPKADAIIANSLGVKADLTENFSIAPEKISVIPNMLDPGEIALSAKRELNGKEKKIFEYPSLITLGRLTYAKGHKHLVRIFLLMKKEMPELKLVIMGSGPLKNEIIVTIKSLNLKLSESMDGNKKADIYMPGHVRNPFRYLSRAKLFLSASLWEGFPNAILEAMACRTPVLSSDCRHGPREILAPGTGVSPLAEGPEYARYGILLPPFSGWNSMEEEKEKLWADTALKILADGSMMEKYAGAGNERATDFSTGKIIPLWKRLLEKYG